MPALIFWFENKDVENRMALIWVVYSQKKKTETQFGFKNLFLSEQHKVSLTVFGDVPLRKSLMVLYFEKCIVRRNPCEVSPLRNVFFFFIQSLPQNINYFFVRKMTKKGQNKSPVILTKIKALLFVQERSWNLLWRRRWSPQFISTIKLHPDVCLSVQLSASQLHHDPKFISKAQNPASIWTVTRLSFLRPSLGPDPLAEKHWRVLSSPGWWGGATLTLRRKQT